MSVSYVNGVRTETHPSDRPVNVAFSVPGDVTLPFKEAVFTVPCDMTVQSVSAEFSSPFPAGTTLNVVVESGESQAITSVPLLVPAMPFDAYVPSLGQMVEVDPATHARAYVHASSSAPAMATCPANSSVYIGCVLSVVINPPDAPAAPVAPSPDVDAPQAEIPAPVVGGGVLVVVTFAPVTGERIVPVMPSVDGQTEPRILFLADVHCEVIGATDDVAMTIDKPSQDGGAGVPVNLDGSMLSRHSRIMSAGDRLTLTAPVSKPVTISLAVR